MPRKTYNVLIYTCILINTLVFIIAYGMSFFEILVVDLILKILCDIDYHICFPEQIRLEQEKKRQYYEELFKNLNDDTNEDNENTKL